MSSFTRTIQRTVKRDEDGNPASARSHYGERGSNLGYTNPRDPCRTGKTKSAKPWRGKGNAPKPKARIAVPQSVKPKRDPEAHGAKMLRKQEARDRIYAAAINPDRVERLLGTPANLDRNGTPHRNARAIARRLRQQNRSA